MIQLVNWSCPTGVAVNQRCLSQGPTNALVLWQSCIFVRPKTYWLKWFQTYRSSMIKKLLVKTSLMIQKLINIEEVVFFFWMLFLLHFWISIRFKQKRAAVVKAQPLHHPTKIPWGPTTDQRSPRQVSICAKGFFWRWTLTGRFGSPKKYMSFLVEVEKKKEEIWIQNRTTKIQNWPEAASLKSL